MLQRYDLGIGIYEYNKLFRYEVIMFDYTTSTMGTG